METKYYREDVEKKLQALEEHASVCMNEQHSHVMGELRTKFSQRENVFAVSNCRIFHLKSFSIIMTDVL